MPDITTVIEALGELERRATVGPWAVDVEMRAGGADQIIELGTGRAFIIAFGTSDGNEDDFPLIAAARNALKPLLAVARASVAAQAHLDEMREAWRIGTMIAHGSLQAQYSNQNAEHEIALRAALTALAAVGKEINRE